MTRKDDMHLELPDSVSSYLRDKEVQTGVDSLGAYELVRMPPSLRWGELPDYYRALLASQQVPRRSPTSMFRRTPATC